jgi:hypothetical protein
MIVEGLFRKPAAVDTQTHRSLRLAAPVKDWSIAAGLNSCFVAALEFGDACAEYPIVFVDAGTDAAGKREAAPVAVLGLAKGQNLFVDPQGHWRAQYQPALLRAYPFGSAATAPDRWTMVVDEGYAGWSPSEGEPLFDAAGQPSAWLGSMRDHLEKLEGEVQRTRAVARALLEAELLTSMRFDATLPDGAKLGVEGFLTVDEKKLAGLPDAKVVELFRNGVLGLVHAHQISLRHMRRLVQWHAERNAGAPERG